MVITVFQKSYLRTNPVFYFKVKTWKQVLISMAKASLNLVSTKMSLFCVSLPDAHGNGLREKIAKRVAYVQGRHTGHSY